MNKYLFLFTICPVQSFIAQARKTRDLYAGSSLLSGLIGFAMNTLKSSLNGECEFIFPDKGIKSKPNRFIAKVESDDIKNVGENLEKSLEKKFEETAKTALDSLKLAYTDKLEESFWKQIKNHLQIYWTALPLNGDYSQTYTKLEHYLGAVKNVRVFQQLEETGRKCSLCGERNVLFYRLTDEEKKKGGLERRADGLLRKLYVRREEVVFYEPKNESEELQIQKGEGLCAVCFTKRFAEKYFEDKYVKDFPSTAEIAFVDWLEKIDGERRHRYESLFNNFDKQLYYEENLREKYLVKYGHLKDRDEDKSKELVSKAKGQLKELYRIKDKNGNEIGKPAKYYALVMLDGDSMGKWLSGEFLEEKGKTGLESFHKKMSEELGKYAAKVEKEIIQPSKGKLVYAGGDDVLAFVNLKSLFDVLTELWKNFPEFEKLEFKIKAGKKSTASAGVVIAHYKTPLSEVLKWARKMEKEAKEKGGRDAFAIAVLKHSGEIHKTVWKWKYEDGRIINPLEVFKKIIKMLNDKEISNTFINNLNIEFSKILNNEGKWNEKTLVETEIKRLVLRSLQRKMDETKEDFDKRKKEINDNLLKDLNLLFSNRKRVDNFLSFLNIADFLARRVR